MMKQENEHWKIDRRIPIALIFTLVLQMLSVLVWATELDARVSSMEKKGIESGNLSEKFIRLDERLDSVKHQLESLNHQVERISDRILKK